ncbi:restriction endonuclease subunit S [Paenibacillus aquistagni]|uniref:restriction endonuclease subunit S n=1 Tax=Paenibacillus aquistagni TaxID=1852522 RepID=UPI000B4FE908|nr:restriction endonuclease subunit S [Paenibacillus aquistagni]
MSEDKVNIPKIRFPGFTDAWEQRKLGDLISKMYGGASIAPDDYRDGGVATVPKGAVNSSGIADLSGSKYVDEAFYNKNSNASVYQNELVTSLRDLVPTAPNMGRIVKLKGSNEKYLMPQGVYRLIINSDVDENFLISFSNTDKFRKVISQEKNGSTQVHIRNSEYLGIPIARPSKEEQQRIGSFFKQLDHLITLHQRKLNNAKNLKAGLLQKMFPKDGEDFPEVRFPGFTDVWKRRELGELANFTKGNGYTKSDLRETGSPIILYGRLYTDYETLIEDVNTFVEFKENSVISLGGEVIVPSSGESAEDIARASVVGKPGIILGGDLNIIKPTEQIDPVFLALAISNGTPYRDMAKRAQGKSVVHLHNSDLKNINLVYPQIEEQKKIVEFNLQIDHLITLHQHKLEHLHQQKKSLLQQMFV